MVAAAVGAVLVAGALAGCGGGPTRELGSPEAFAKALFLRTNDARVADGLPEYVWNDCLARKALPRATAIVPQETLTHEGLFASCLSDQVRAGENLSRSDRYAAEVVDAWLGSAGHRANLLDAGFLESGIACVPVSAVDPTRAARSGEDVAAMACSQLFEGGS